MSPPARLLGRAPGGGGGGGGPPGFPGGGGGGGGPGGRGGSTPLVALVPPEAVADGTGGGLGTLGALFSMLASFNWLTTRGLFWSSVDGSLDSTLTGGPSL